MARQPQFVALDGTVKIEVLVDRNAVVALVTSGHMTATGSSKREPGEVFDEEVGPVLAVGRALANLGAQFMTAAEQRLSDKYGEPVVTKP